MDQTGPEKRKLLDLNALGLTDAQLDSYIGKEIAVNQDLNDSMSALRITLKDSSSRAASRRGSVAGSGGGGGGEI